LADIGKKKGKRDGVREKWSVQLEEMLKTEKSTGPKPNWSVLEGKGGKKRK